MYLKVILYRLHVDRGIFLINFIAFNNQSLFNELNLKTIISFIIIPKSNNFSLLSIFIETK